MDIKLRYQTKAMIWYRKDNEARALNKTLADDEVNEPSYEDGRILLDGTSLDKEPEPVKEESSEQLPNRQEEESKAEPEEQIM